MKFPVVFACLLVTIHGASLPSTFGNTKVTGGEVADLRDVPWHVALEKLGIYIACSASIISRNYVLTSARCIDPSDIIYIRLKSDRLESGGTSLRVTDVIKHPLSENSISPDYDVAILKLSLPVVLNEFAQIVPLSLKAPQAGEVAQVTGWGTLHDNQAEYLQKTNVTIIDRTTCDAAYDRNVTKRMICDSGSAGVGPCWHDRGSPLTIRGVQVGFVSWGISCGIDELPVVYSNVASYKEFIDENTDNEVTWV